MSFEHGGTLFPTFERAVAAMAFDWLYGAEDAQTGLDALDEAGPEAEAREMVDEGWNYVTVSGAHEWDEVEGEYRPRRVEATIEDLVTGLEAARLQLQAKVEEIRADELAQG